MRLEPLEVFRQRPVTLQRYLPPPIQRGAQLLIGQAVAPQHPFTLLRQRIELRAECSVLGQAQPGLAETLQPMAVAPRQIPYHAGFVYFELDKSNELWRSLKTSGGVAFHQAGEFPGLSMEFWAIRS